MPRNWRPKSTERKVLIITGILNYVLVTVRCKPGSSYLRVRTKWVRFRNRARPESGGHAKDALRVDCALR